MDNEGESLAVSIFIAGADGRISLRKSKTSPICTSTSTCTCLLYSLLHSSQERPKMNEHASL